MLIVGTGPYYDYIRELAEKVNKKSNKEIVKVLGTIIGNEKIKLINSSDIVVGVSRVALEGLACGRPVIITGESYLEGKKETFFGGIVTEDNAEELKYYNFCYKRNSEKITPDKIAEAAMKLLTNERYRHRVEAFGREFVVKEYDANKIAGQLERVYSSLKN
jgi:glycosyltransferase involved in cell wall biosynthesis